MLQDMTNMKGGAEFYTTVTEKGFLVLTLLTAIKI